MTEKMIPLSVIDAEIDKINDYEGNWHNFEVIQLLEEIKKEAIPSSSELEGGLHCPVCHFDYTKQKRTKTIEQKIKELEEIMDIIEPYDHPEFLYEHKKKLWHWYIELRKLIPVSGKDLSKLP